MGGASFGEGAEKCMEVYQALKRLLTISGYQTGVGDDGGFVPDLRNSEEALEFAQSQGARAILVTLDGQVLDTQEK